VDRHLFFALSPKNVLPASRRCGSPVSPDMVEEAQLYGASYNQWVNNVNTVRTFATNRGNIYRNFILQVGALHVPGLRRGSSSASRPLRSTRVRSRCACGDPLHPEDRILLQRSRGPDGEGHDGASESTADVVIPFEAAVNGVPGHPRHRYRERQSSEAADSWRWPRRSPIPLHRSARRGPREATGW
jgi:hypothetical protein